MRTARTVRRAAWHTAAEKVKYPYVFCLGVDLCPEVFMFFLLWRIRFLCACIWYAPLVARLSWPLMHRIILISSHCERCVFSCVWLDCVCRSFCLERVYRKSEAVGGGPPRPVHEASFDIVWDVRTHESGGHAPSGAIQ